MRHATKTIIVLHIKPTQNTVHCCVYFFQ